MDFVHYDAHLEAALAPEPIKPDSRVVDPFDEPTGVMATLMARLRDEGLIHPRDFYSYRQRDLVGAMKPAATRLYGIIRASWEAIQSIEMSGLGEEAPVLEEMIDSFWNLLVIMASLSPYLSTEDMRNYLRKPYQFTVYSLSRASRTNLTLR